MTTQSFNRPEWSLGLVDAIATTGIWFLLRFVTVDAGLAATPVLALVDALFAAAVLCFAVGLAGYWVDFPVRQSTLGTAGALFAVLGGITLGVDAAYGLASSDGWTAVAVIAGAVVLALVVVPLVVARLSKAVGAT